MGPAKAFGLCVVTSQIHPGKGALQLTGLRQLVDSGVLDRHPSASLGRKVLVGPLCMG